MTTSPIAQVEIIGVSPWMQVRAVPNQGRRWWQFWKPKWVQEQCRRGTILEVTGAGAVQGFYTGRTLLTATGEALIIGGSSAGRIYVDKILDRGGPAFLISGAGAVQK